MRGFALERNGWLTQQHCSLPSPRHHRAAAPVAWPCMHPARGGSCHAVETSTVAQVSEASSSRVPPRRATSSRRRRSSSSAQEAQPDVAAAADTSSSGAYANAAGGGGASASATASPGSAVAGNSGRAGEAHGASSSSAAGMQLPPPPDLEDVMAAKSAADKLLALQRMQQATHQAMQQAFQSGKFTGASSYPLGQARTVDVRLYEQVVAAQNRLAQRLSETNGYIQHLENTIEELQGDVQTSFELLKQVSMEFGTTNRLAEAAVAAMRFGVDPLDAEEKVSQMAERLATLEAAVMEQRATLSGVVARKVPMEWVGVATEVRLMGDFDNWTRGVSMHQEDMDSVFSKFETTLSLKPGVYRVKLLVDGEWRLCADWPNEDDGKGNTVNVLTVA